MPDRDRSVNDPPDEERVRGIGDQEDDEFDDSDDLDDSDEEEDDEQEGTF